MSFVIKSSGYDVLFGTAGHILHDLVRRSGYDAVYLLTDDNTFSFCLPVLRNTGFEIPDSAVFRVTPGEENKDLLHCELIWDFLHNKKAGRNTVIINLGGGVLTDLGAFAASVYKRGIYFIQVPTSLLAQVDAAVGTKTGIDFRGEKNMIGTFTAPKAVLIDAQFLKTLPPAELLSGTAEMIKHGLISDAAYYAELFNSLPSCLRTGEVYPHLIERSVTIKNQIVIEDPFEKGLRKSLNFGHTAGHAFEAFSYRTTGMRHLSHGEAIAMGMVCELYLSSLIPGGLTVVSRNHCTAFLCSLFPMEKVAFQAYEELYALMGNDKKNENQKINFTLITQIGKSSVNNHFLRSQVFESIDYFNSLAK